MRYLSVCSGIEAATVAWHPLGWTPVAFAEIDAFPCAVLRHHYPDVPNARDFRMIQGDEYGAIDLLVGGTPCQDFSIAGLRAGVAGDRGNLTLEFLRLAQRVRPRWLVWENVPGIYSSTSHTASDPCPPRSDMGVGPGEPVVVTDEYDADESHAFACFLAGLQELGYGFAWRTLDAQFFGVPQRRRRVFVVGHLGDWRCAAAVLFERHSLSGYPPPKREAGKRAPTIPSRRTGGGGLGTDLDCDGGLIASTGDTSHCLNAGGMGRQDYETETLVSTFQNTGQGWWNESPTAQPLRSASGGGTHEANVVAIPLDMRQASRGATMTNNRPDGSSGGAPGTGIGEDGDPAPTVAASHIPAVCHTLRADGFDASEDGTGRGTPLVPIAIQGEAIRENPDSGPGGIGVREDGQAFTLEARSEVQAVAFDCKASGRNGFGVGETSPTLRSMAHKDSHSNAGGQVAVAVSANQRSEVREREVHGSLNGSKSGTQFDGIMQGMAVRRLTPEECEALQGFPRGYTKITPKTADGPRYKALGNSMAVPCMTWLGKRIQAVENLGR